MSDPPSSTGLPEGRPVLGVSVCVWRGEEVLLVRRGRPPSRGRWAPVGGKVEFGERLAEAARREVKEETGVDCAVAGMSDIRELILPDRTGMLKHHVVLAVFGARWLAGEAVAGDDAEAVAWVRPEALDRLDLIEGVIPYIMATRRVIGGSEA